MKVSIVVISKNEPALAETLDAFVPLLDGLARRGRGRRRVGRAGSTSSASGHEWVKWVTFTPRPGRGHDPRAAQPRRRRGDRRRHRLHRLRMRARSPTGCHGFSPRSSTGVSRSPAGAPAPAVAASTKGTPDGVAPRRGRRSRRARARRGVPDDQHGLPPRGVRAASAGSTSRSSTARTSTSAGGSPRPGCAIRYVPDAVVVHDWGDRRRQTHRAIAYGRARAHLYCKHPDRHRRRCCATTRSSPRTRCSCSGCRSP